MYRLFNNYAIKRRKIKDVSPISKEEEEEENLLNLSRVIRSVKGTGCSKGEGKMFLLLYNGKRERRKNMKLDINKSARDTRCVYRNWLETNSFQWREFRALLPLLPLIQ